MRFLILHQGQGTASAPGDRGATALQAYLACARPSPHEEPAVTQTQIPRRVIEATACSSDARAAGRLTDGETRGHGALSGCCCSGAQGPSCPAVVGVTVAVRSPGTTPASPSPRRVTRGQGQTKRLFCLSQVAEIFSPSSSLDFICILLALQHKCNSVGITQKCSGMLREPSATEQAGVQVRGVSGRQSTQPQRPLWLFPTGACLHLSALGPFALSSACSHQLPAVPVTN